MFDEDSARRRHMRPEAIENAGNHRRVLWPIKQQQSNALPPQKAWVKRHNIALVQHQSFRVVAGEILHHQRAEISA